MTVQYQLKFLLVIITWIATVWAIPHGICADEAPPFFETYGFAQADYIQDFRRVNPAWESTLRPSRIPTVDDQFGSDGQAIISVKQSRFGVKGNLPVQGQDLSTKLEFDFFGVGPDEGQTTIRLRHAYGEWKQWLGGQTNSLFMDGDVFPNVLDYWGPSGMVFLRTPQIRWTPMMGADTFAVAIEHATGDIDTDPLREVDPALGANVRADEKLPDLTAQARLNRGWGHLQLSGILRKVGFDTPGAPGADPKDSDLGWGLNLGSNVKAGSRGKLYLSVTYGEGIASYMNDGGTDLAPEGLPGNLSPKAVPLLGMLAYYEHAWSDQWSSTLGYSRTQVDNTDFQATNAFQIGEYASANIAHMPDKNILVGAEVLWGARTDKNEAYGDDLRTQITFKYLFSSRDWAQQVR